MTRRLCSHCGQPIILVPSAEERARKFGGSPSDYTARFTIHSDCILHIRDGKPLPNGRRE